MHIEYSETEAFFGDYQRVKYTLSNGDLCHIHKNCLEKCSTKDSIVFVSSLLNDSVFNLLVNGISNYISWEYLWSLYAKFDERIGVIKHYDYCNLLLKKQEPLSFNNIEPEDFINLVKGRTFRTSCKFNGYRLNYSYLNGHYSEKNIFEYVERQLYDEKFQNVKGFTINAKCLNLIEI